MRQSKSGNGLIKATLADKGDLIDSYKRYADGTAESKVSHLDAAFNYSMSFSLPRIRAI